MPGDMQLLRARANEQVHAHLSKELTLRLMGVMRVRCRRCFSAPWLLTSFVSMTGAGGGRKCDDLETPLPIEPTWIRNKYAEHTRLSFCCERSPCCARNIDARNDGPRAPVWSKGGAQGLPVAALATGIGQR